MIHIDSLVLERRRFEEYFQYEVWGVSTDHDYNRTYSIAWYNDEEGDPFVWDTSNYGLAKDDVTCVTFTDFLARLRLELRGYAPL